MERVKREHFGVYAVILNTKRHEILLITKKRGPYIGLLDLPGGKPQFHETFIDTLAREVLEETGLTLISSTQLKTCLCIKDFPTLTLRHTGVLYSVDVSGEVNPAGDEEDSAGARWINIRQIEESTVTPFVEEAVLGL